MVLNLSGATLLVFLFFVFVLYYENAPISDHIDSFLDEMDRCEGDRL